MSQQIPDNEMGYIAPHSPLSLVAGQHELEAGNMVEEQTLSFSERFDLMLTEAKETAETQGRNGIMFVMQISLVALEVMNARSQRDICGIRWGTHMIDQRVYDAILEHKGVLHRVQLPAMVMADNFRLALYMKRPQGWEVVLSTPLFDWLMKPELDSVRDEANRRRAMLAQEFTSRLYGFPDAEAALWSGHLTSKLIIAFKDIIASEEAARAKALEERILEDKEERRRLGHVDSGEED